MPGIIATYPDGRVGTGLLLLRLSVAASILLAPDAATAMAPPWIRIVLVVGLALGFWTRACAALGIAMMLTGLLRGTPPAATGTQLLAAGAILLLGAGAYSCDCIAFGRRTIVLKRNG